MDEDGMDEAALCQQRAEKRAAAATAINDKQSSSGKGGTIKNKQSNHGKGGAAVKGKSGKGEPAVGRREMRS